MIALRVPLLWPCTAEQKEHGVWVDFVGLRFLHHPLGGLSIFLSQSRDLSLGLMPHRSWEERS